MPYQWERDVSALLENVNDSATLTRLHDYKGKHKGRYESILPFLRGLTPDQLLSAVFHSDFPPGSGGSSTNILHRICFHDHCPPQGCADVTDVFELGSYIIDTYATDPRHDEYVGMPNYSLYTPLHYAAQSCNEPLVKKLVEHYPKALFMKNVRGDTPLKCAQQFGSEEVGTYLNWAMTEYAVM
ncbi:hypothetical protein TrST_g6961 [Triparma strigata]|uniref:Uncharacterized protein n=1 Tax=Triparma strigata TaxID=1606541 RepID=A0A9W7BIP4_9STRA|nr:hypothetical protein TrST_g6961 [Triparma strigata]